MQADKRPRVNIRKCTITMNTNYYIYIYIYIYVYRYIYIYIHTSYIYIYVYYWLGTVAFLVAAVAYARPAAFRSPRAPRYLPIASWLADLAS